MSEARPTKTHVPEAAGTEQSRISSWGTTAQKAWFAAAQAVFGASSSPVTRTQAWFQRAWLVGLLLAILAMWAYFLQFGQFVFGVQDWIWEWRYARILRMAALTGQLPLHTQPPIAYGVDRFLAIPDVPLGPQWLILRFLDLGPAFLATFLLMVLIGYVGCLAIRRYWRLSLFSFTLLAVLFNFNGFIVTHIGIGHTLFSGYFLLPFFVLLTLQLIEGSEGRGWFAWMGLTLFGIELQGTTQIYAACMIFLGVLLLAYSAKRLQILYAMLAGVGLNLYRIAPSLITLTTYTNRPQPGFISVLDVLESMLRIVPPSKASKLITGLPLGWWELDMYLGVLGLILLAYFGIVRVWAQSTETVRGPGLPLPLGLSMLALGIFSIGYLYWPINYLPLPLLSLLHVPSRFLILPLLILMVLSVRTLQSWLAERRLGFGSHALLLALLVILTHDLIQHARLWRVEHVFEAFPPAALDTTLHIVDRADPVYIAVLAGSTAASALGLVFIAGFLVRQSRRRQPQA